MLVNCYYYLFYQSEPNLFSSSTNFITEMSAIENRSPSVVAVDFVVKLLVIEICIN